MNFKKTKVILTILLIVQVILVRFLSDKPNWIDLYYSNQIYPLISKFLRFIFGWIPFSIGDILILLLLILFVRFVYILIKKRFKNIGSALLSITSFMSIVYFCFYFFWGLNYFRNPLAKNLNFSQKKYTTEQLKKITKQIITRLNELQLAINNNDLQKVSIPYTQKEIYSKAILGYVNLAKVYPEFKYKHTSIKSSLVSVLQTYNRTLGYLNPITGEAQVNYNIPKIQIPATTCHEIAHQIGIASENEANFVGFLASIFNTDLYFKYSGYRMAFSYCISELRNRDASLYIKLWKTLDLGVIEDFKQSSSFWERYKNPIEPFLKKGYDSYLKANNQSKGIESYNYVVNLLIAFFKKNHTLNPPF